ncbi:MAG TPA: amidase [Solirubrobacteraceae bacterium]|nr:amidase [Solirubrobacteraceae bacterium]
MVDAERTVGEALERIAAQPELNAVITICADEALARARAGVSGRLAGVPLLVKDLIDTAGIRTTYASSIYRDHVPTRTAPAVAALEAEGAIVVAKANADEFAWGVCGQNVHYGDTVNPIAPDRVAGGSSSGNAAALATGMVPLALGTDTGGSVRVPAAACGVVGLKPALGAVPTEGVFPLATTFDTVGPMARTVAECALAHAVLTGAPVPEPRLRGLRAGVLTARPPLAFGEPPAARDERALAHAERLRALGAEVVETTLPVPEGDTWPVFFADAAAAHVATFPARRDEYGPTIRAKLDHALTLKAEDVARGREAVGAWRARAAREPDVDLIVSPVLGLDELPPAGVDELEVRVAMSGYARAFSFLGWPAIAIGNLQLAGRDAAVVIGAALALEREDALR